MPGQPMERGMSYNILIKGGTVIDGQNNAPVKADVRVSGGKIVKVGPDLKREGVDVRTYRIIYQAIEDIEKAMKGLLKPEFKEVVGGHAEIRNIIRISSVGVVAGSYVTDGKIARGSSVRLLRDGVVVFEGKMAGLRRFKDDVREVERGYECGISLDGYSDIKEGDIIESFTTEEIKAE